MDTELNATLLVLPFRPWALAVAVALAVASCARAPHSRAESASQPDRPPQTQDGATGQGGTAPRR
jgi:hypothetical protein